jgi:hypothetical protein
MSENFKRGSVFLLVIFMFSGFSGTLFGQNQWRQINNEAFKSGEKLEYKFYYDAWLTGKVTAGTGVMEVKETEKKFNERMVYHIDTEGQSKGMFNWFFKVHDEFDSFMDKDFIAPHYFIRKTREGGYKKDDEYIFDHVNKTVTTRKKTNSIPKYTQDFISALYFARTFQSDTLEAGDMLPINFFIDDSVYNSAIVYEGKEIINIELGKFRCLRFKPGMATGEVFSNKYPMTLWVTDDKNHIPVLAVSAVIIGNVKAELMKYEGLASPLTSLLEKFD